MTLRDLQECLWRAFIDEGFYDPQAREQRWAVVEGIRRLNVQTGGWKIVTARKEHECVRGCQIKRHQAYVQRLIGAGWGNDWKFCLGCTAMIFYFKDVHELRPQMYTHWDLETQRPVRIKD